MFDTAFIAAYFGAALESEQRKLRIERMSDQQRDQFYREEASKMRRREIVAQEKLADAMSSRARRLWL